MQQYIQNIFKTVIKFNQGIMVGTCIIYSGSILFYIMKDCHTIKINTLKKYDKKINS